MKRVLLNGNKPESSLFWGYVTYAVLGTFLLSLPWFRKVDVPVIDNLFNAVSAISTTGLATISIFDSYNMLGQFIILVLIQLGGIGYMTLGSFIILSTRKTISENREMIHKTAFSLPRDFDMKKFIKSLVIYTFAVEVMGTILLLFAFWHDDRANVLWSAVFHSVSAFCTAGFSLYNNSFESYANSMFLNLVIFILSFLGAIGYIVMVDFWLMLRRKKNNITFTSKVILVTSILLLIVGTLLIFTENSLKGNIQNNSLLSSFFLAMSALTTVGFNTIPVAGLSSSVLFVISVLMIIGASPSGTGGGIKSTTVSSLFGVLTSVFSSHKEYVNYKYKVMDKNLNSNINVDHHHTFNIFHRQSKKKNNKIKADIEKKNTELYGILGRIFKIKIFNNTIPFDRVVYAIATFTFYFVILFAGVFLLLTTECFSFEQIFFEAASALGTVGLSMGITGSLSILGKLITTSLMFFGRLGPITLGIVLFNRFSKKVIIEDETNNHAEDIVI